MQRLLGRRVAAGVLTAMVAPLAGCGGDSGPPASTLGSLTGTRAPSSADPSPGASGTTSSTPTLAAPVPDPRISERTAAGAEAAVRHYFELLNFGFHGGDPAVVAQFTEDDCESCRAQLDAWASSLGSDAPRKYEPDLIVLSAQCVSIRNASSSEVIATATRPHASATRPTASDGRMSGVEVETATYRFNLLWKGTHWSIADYEALNVQK